VVGGTKLAFAQDSDSIGIFVVLRFDFLREPKPSLSHREEERLRRGVIGLLGHAQAFGCVAAMILGVGHYAVIPRCLTHQCGPPPTVPLTPLIRGGNSLIRGG
jgi:hypothetical protein